MTATYELKSAGSFEARGYNHLLSNQQTPGPPVQLFITSFMAIIPYSAKVGTIYHLYDIKGSRGQTIYKYVPTYSGRSSEFIPVLIYSLKHELEEGGLSMSSRRVSR